MRLAKLLGLAFVAIFVLAAALSSVASAEPAIKILPESATERKFKGETDEANPKLEALFGSVTCAKATASGTEGAKGDPLGLFHIEFTGCKGFGLVPCLGLGDAKEVILVLGTWHLVYDQISPSLLSATDFLIEPVHFECKAGITLLVEVLGQVLCLDLEPTSQKESHLFHCHQKEALQLETTFWTDDGQTEVKKAELLCRDNEGTYSHCAELALGLVKHEVNLFADI